MKVLVAGATGGCGRIVVRRLSDLGIATQVLTRDARRAASLGPVEVVEGNAYHTTIVSERSRDAGRSSAL